MLILEGEWLSPGGLPGLQNRSAGRVAGRGGFDSHALPPILLNLFPCKISVTILLYKLEELIAR